MAVKQVGVPICDVCRLDRELETYEILYPSAGRLRFDLCEEHQNTGLQDLLALRPNIKGRKSTLRVVEPGEIERAKRRYRRSRK